MMDFLNGSSANSAKAENQAVFLLSSSSSSVLQLDLRQDEALRMLGSVVLNSKAAEGKRNVIGVSAHVDYLNKHFLKKTF